MIRSCSQFDYPEYFSKPPRIPTLKEYWGIVKESNNMETVVGRNRVLFHPVYAFGTAAVRGEKALTSDVIAYWDTRVCQHLYGTSVMFGVGTRAAQTRAPSRFIDLLGEDAQSYGLNHHGEAKHNGVGVKVCDPLPRRECVVGILFDGPGRKISYYQNGEYICTPFTDINLSVELYPMISSTAQQSQFLVENQSCKYVTRTLADAALQKVHSMFPATYASLPLPRNVILKLGQLERRRRIYGKRPARKSRSNLQGLFNEIRCGMGVEDDQ